MKKQRLFLTFLGCLGTILLLAGWGVWGNAQRVAAAPLQSDFTYSNNVFDLSFSDIIAIDDAHTWAVGDAGVIVASANGGGSWTLQTSSTTSDLHAITFIDASQGWVAGRDGVILHTANGGASWLRQPSATNEALLDIFFTDAAHGWAAGEGGVLLKTTNGGQSWQKITNLPAISGNPLAQVVQVKFLTDQVGWVAAQQHASRPGDFGGLWKTEDGGVTWQQQMSGHYVDSFDFADATHGWILTYGGEVLATTDGGSTWAQISDFHPSNGFHYYGKQIVFTSPTEGWALDRIERITRTEQYFHGRLFHTGDGGVTWACVNCDLPASETVAISPSGKVWVAGRGEDDATGYHIYGFGLYITKSDDGGGAWTRQLGLSSPQSAVSVEGVNATTALVLSRRSLLRTDYRGLIWQEVSSIPDALNGIRPRDISSPDGQHIWVAEDHGRIIRSDNGGADWRVVRDSGPDLNAIAFLSRRTGVAVGDSGVILMTSDGGDSWAQAASHTSLHLNDVTWVDAQTIIVVGDNGTIVRSVDGGASWDLVGAGVTRDLRAVDFAPGQTSGWIVGDDMVILRSSDAGATWRKQRQGGGRGGSVLALSDTQGVVTAENHRAVTQNAGNAWDIAYTGIDEQDLTTIASGYVLSAGDSIWRYRLIGAGAPVSPGLVRAFPVASPPTIDGSLEDWPTGGEVLLNANAASYVAPRSIPSLDDLSGSLRMLWDDQNLYIALAVTDDHIVADSADVWRDDVVELGFDAARDYQKGADDHKITLNVDGRVTDWGAPIASLTVVTKAVPGGWNMEIAIPRQTLAAPQWQDGVRMGFDWTLHDDDDGGDWDSYLFWQSTHPFMSDLHDLGQIMLVGNEIVLRQGYEDYTGLSEAVIDAWHPNENHCGQLDVRAPDVQSSLLKFDLRGYLPNEATITSAQLKFHVLERSNEHPLQMGVYALKRAWRCNEATWSQAAQDATWGAPGANDTTSDRSPDPLATLDINAVGQTHTVDITALAQAWLDQQAPNDGVILRGDSQDPVAYALASSSYWNPDLRPQLIVQYDLSATPTPTPMPTPRSLYLPIVFNP